jgi:exodeoxyribonuclease VIII
MDSNFIKSVNIISDTSDYYNLDAISVSGMKKIKQSPAHFKNHEEIEPTDAMIFGSAYHMYVLEPKKFEEQYYIFDDSAICMALIGDGYKSPRATKDYKAWQESEMRIIGNKSVINKAVFERIKEMKSRLFQHPYAKMLLTNGLAEVGYSGTIATDAGEINIKFKPDYVKTEKRIVVDLKTAADASIDGFTKAAADQDYHIQAAFYSDMLEHIAGDKRAYSFIFIAQEKTLPYAFNLFECSPQFISQGRYEYELLLQLYKYCIDNNKWPGYQCFCNNRYGLLQLELPKWAIKSLDYYTY